MRIGRGGCDFPRGEFRLPVGQAKAAESANWPPGRAAREGLCGAMVGVLDSLMGKKKEEEGGVWEDREIRFDAHPSLLEMRAGEVMIDSINSVEDTKGNNGEKGSLSITNLRLIWQCHRNSRVNLSIGYTAVLSLNIRQANSRLRGSTQALYVMTKYNNSRFEFVFTNLVRQSPRLFTTVQVRQTTRTPRTTRRRLPEPPGAPPPARGRGPAQRPIRPSRQAVYRAYDTSRLYRDLKLRGAIIKNKTLVLLPTEQMYTPHLPY